MMGPILSNRSLRDCVQSLAGSALPDRIASRIELHPARHPGRGDCSTDAALVAAGWAGEPAPHFADRLALQLATLPGIARASVARGSHINLVFADVALDRILPALLEGSPPLAQAARAAAPMRFATAQMRLGDPIFMVQYAHARCYSVLRGAGGLGFSMAPREWLMAAAGQFRSGPGRSVLCALDHWTRLADPSEPPPETGRIELFLRDLSLKFDQLWKAGPDGATVRLLYPGEPSRSLAHLALVLATADVIRSGLGLLGVVAAEEIR